MGKSLYQEQIDGIEILYQEQVEGYGELVVIIDHDKGCLEVYLNSVQRLKQEVTP